MASVYYLLDDALHVADEIVEKYSQQDQNLKENHYAATVIQRTYRGYVVRKAYKQVIQAAVVLQKYIRAWLVRFHLLDTYQEYWDQTCLNRYNRAATKLQAAWKGILVRKEIDIKQIMKNKQKEKEIARQFFHISSDIEFQIEKDQKDGEEAPKTEDESAPFETSSLSQDLFIKMEILEMLFDRHHLLSTKIHSGVLKTSNELKMIEEVLKTLPWKDYTKGMKKIYYKTHKILKDLQPTYIFRDRKMRQMEDLFKSRDKSHDIREPYMGKCIADNRKPFNKYPKLDGHPYERSLLLEGKYVKAETNIKRTEDRSKNISSQDFIITLKQIAKESKIPPYYIDFWYNDCMGHAFPE